MPLDITAVSFIIPQNGRNYYVNLSKYQYVSTLGVMRHKNKYVIKKGIQLYERWNSKEGIKIIKTLHFEEMRFQKYAEQVIEYLERDGV